ncbi:hypothetical protein LX36DRAFT_649503 [Colletotrichum falcatum]|nr:hypothetical protein LX36DRAFT_649503 [Colletotrichum falcatum]
MYPSPSSSSSSSVVERSQPLADPSSLYQIWPATGPFWTCYAALRAGLALALALALATDPWVKVRQGEVKGSFHSGMRGKARSL